MKKPAKAKEESLPRDPLERSCLRTTYIWRGLLRLLKKNDYYRLWEAFITVGLVDKREVFYVEHLFEPNPSDDTLKRLKKFSELKPFPKLTGRKPGRNFISDGDDDLLPFYYALLYMIKRIHHKSSPVSRSKGIERILAKFHVDNIDDGLLKKWRDKTNTNLVEHIIGHIFNKKHATVHKDLTKAKKKLPKIHRAAMIDPEKFLKSPALFMALLNTPDTDR